MRITTYMNLDAVDVATLIKRKEVSPEEILSLAYQRLQEVNPELNAVIHSREEKVRREAAKISLDQPLAGIPMLLKDISQAVKGEPLTAGTGLLKDNIAKQDSHFVARLREAGTLFLGHTNTPELGLKNITEPELYGVTKNPWNVHHSAGGSSGGSAASVAAGVVPIAGASDGGGSIRIPASFTGLVGLKPTRGRTPVGPGAGRQWQGAAIDFVLSRTVRDSALMLDVLQTIQPEAAFQTPLYPGSYYDDLMNGSPKKFRVAFSTDSPVGTPVSAEAVKAVEKVVKWLEEQGHEVEERANEADGIRLMNNYYLMNSGEIAGVILRLEKALGRAVTFQDMEIVSWVLYTAGKNVSAAEFSLSLAEWDVAAAKMAEFHQVYDLYLTPATAFPAPENGELTHDETEITALLKVDQLDKQEQQQLIYDMFEPSLVYTPFTQLANLTGQPAISLPVHLTEECLPLGVQFTAPKGKEEWLLQLSAELEQSDLWIGMKGNPLISRS